MRIANYQTLEQISKVACVVLYRARYLKDGKLVLLKQLDPAHADAVHSEHFKREYQLLQSLDVAELVKPIALIDEQGELAAIHEDFPGESLDAILAEGAPLDWPVCLVIARYPAYALEGIHAARVIHQDIPGHYPLRPPQWRGQADELQHRPDPGP